ncbi:MAG TPA: ferric reductase-like transmembrane domain-containing protein [Ktedonobacterales bacterium]|nr:ferric reductase-like transmembrane domain-containing protein [Ktedonobacterales bacterium]
MTPIDGISTIALGSLSAQAAHLSLALHSANQTAKTTTATTSNPTLWYLTRAAAVAAYITLTLTAGLGLLRSMARMEQRANARYLWFLDETHQFVALLTGAFLALHLGSLLFDPFLPYSLLNELLPVNEPYRALPSALGVLSLYAMAIVLGTSWLRRRIPYSLWRALHYVSFALFVLVTAHGLLIGSDTGQGWMNAIYFGASAFIAALVVMRVLLAPKPVATPARTGRR